MSGAVAEGMHIVRMSTTLQYASDDDACGAAFAGGPVALAYSRFDAAVREDAHAEYLRSIESWRTGRGFAVPGEFVVARGARRPPGHGPNDAGESRCRSPEGIDDWERQRT